MESSPQKKADAVCNVCSKTFRRPEHLKRHKRVHEAQASFKCSQCSKAFYRRDVLQRHLLVHTTNSSSLPKSNKRACLRCASAHVRCSGTSRCSRCAAKNLVCEYSPAWEEESVPLDQESTHERSDQPAIRARRSPVGLDIDLSPSARSQAQTGSRRTVANEVARDDTQPIHQDASVPNRSSVGSLIFDRPGTSNIASGQRPGAHQLQSSLLTGIQHGPLDEMYRHEQSSNIAGLRTASLIGEPHMSINNHLQPQDESLGFLPQLSNEPSYGPAILRTGNWTDLDLSPEAYLDLDGLNFPYDPDNVVLELLNQRGTLQYAPATEPVATSTVSSDRTAGSVVLAPSPMPSSSSRNDRSSCGEYYVDGDEGRLPRVHAAYSKLGRYSLHSLPTAIDSAIGQVVPSQGPYTRSGDEGYLRTSRFEEAHYNSIQLALQDTLKRKALSDINDTSELPNIEFCAQSFRLYWEFFAPLMPIIHPKMQPRCKESWILTLAMSAIGSIYLENKSEAPSSGILIDLLRAVLDAHKGLFQRDGEQKLLYIQASILACICFAYHGETLHTSAANQTHSFLAEFAKGSVDRLCNLGNNEDDYPSSMPHDEAWRKWVTAETFRRVWYAIWMLDVMWRFHFQRKPLLSLDLALAPLPCAETRWNAGSASEWRSNFSGEVGGSLVSLLQDICIEKKLEPKTSEFSRILLIHALFRRTWDVETFYQLPLSIWEPTAERQASASLGPPLPHWPPSIAAFRKWRNAVCDALDVIHWSANATIGMHQNLEHPTVLHLHLARLVVLAPYDNILSLAKLMGVYRRDETWWTQFVRESHVIRLWTTKDGHKARLSMIHAGVSLWHVQRFSMAAFYESNSLIMTILSLWAFASFSSSPTETPAVDPARERTSHAVPQAQEHQPVEGTEHFSGALLDNDSEEPLPLVHLDRPTDDELVQLFVRHGERMHANVAGVGNIYHPQAPMRILVLGRKILDQRKAWGIASRHREILDELIRMSQQSVATNASEI